MRVILALVAILLGIVLFVQMKPAENPGSGDLNRGIIFDALSVVPDNENTRAIAAVNLYERASTQLQFNLPEEFSPEEVLDYAFLLRSHGGMEYGPFISGFTESYTISQPVMDENAGYDLSDISLSIWAGLGSDVYQAITFKAGKVEVYETLKGSEVWPTPQAHAYRGIQTLAWGEDLNEDSNQQFNPPVYNQLGQPVRMAFYQETLLAALRQSQLESMIDALSGRNRSLAENAVYQKLIGGAQTLKLYSMVFSSRTQSMEVAVNALRRTSASDEDFAQKLEALHDEPKLLPYQGIVTGIGRDESGQFYMGLAIAHDNENEASANQELLLKRLSGDGVTSWKRPWNEIFDHGDADIEVAHSVVVAKIPFSENRASNAWRDWFYSQDFLLLHE